MVKKGHESRSRVTSAVVRPKRVRPTPTPRFQDIILGFFIDFKLLRRQFENNTRLRPKVNPDDLIRNVI